jgi:hypothetical protein
MIVLLTQFGFVAEFHVEQERSEIRGTPRSAEYRCSWGDIVVIRGNVGSEDRRDG